jgi:hypothetical protein
LSETYVMANNSWFRTDCVEVRFVAKALQSRFRSRKSDMPPTIHIPGLPRINGDITRGTVLWRYLDAAKLFDFFQNSTLYFARADKFEDKFEGAFTPSLRDEIGAAYKKKNIDFTYDLFKQRMRASVFVNCWHRSSDDSAAMWALYGKSDCAVALTTTVGQLYDALVEQNLPQDIAIERVEYIKHWRDPKIDIAPYARVFAYKTKAYEHEKEVRVLLDRSLPEYDQDVPEAGISIKISPATLLRSIVIGPAAPEWFGSLIRQSVLRYQITAPVRRSKLANDPI